ncbi:hypothetical protein BGC_01810 [Burkholderia sp. 3C]
MQHGAAVAGQFRAAIREQLTHARVIGVMQGVTVGIDDIAQIDAFCVGEKQAN